MDEDNVKDETQLVNKQNLFWVILMMILLIYPTSNTTMKIEYDL